MDKKYLSTCYIDKRNELVGSLFISPDKSMYIDFGLKDIFINGHALGIRDRAFNILVLLIKSYNNVVECSDIAFDIWPDEDRDTEDKMISNAITYLRNHNEFGKYLRTFVGKKKGGGYSFKLGENFAIRRINVLQSEIHDMVDVFTGISSDRIVESVFDTTVRYVDLDKEATKRVNSAPEKTAIAEVEPIVSSISMSSKFFHSRANELINSDIDTIDNEMDKLSSVFNMISKLKDADSVLTFDNIVDDLYDRIVDSCHDKQIKNILKIKGPLGSYKTRILEFIYLKLEKEKGDILPFYINVSFYEKMAENNEMITEDELINAFMDDFNIIEKLVKENPDKIPLLILDSIRDFKIGKEFFYSTISRCIKKLNLKLVVSLDSDFTMNPQRRYSLHPLAPNTFTYFLRIRSMQLYNKKKSVEFIKNCVNVFNIPTGQDDENIDAQIEPIYDQFINMNLLSIDAFWLYNLLKLMSENAYNQDYTISDLYHSICAEFLGDEDLMDSTMELAYEYEYGSIDLRKTNCFFDIRWRLIRRHRSVLEYFIASKYIKMLSNLDFSEKNREQTIKDLDFFNMVLPKTITRFIVSEINEIEDYEHNVLIIAEKYYNELSLFGKSELTFWMGRLKNSKRKSRSIELLKAYRETEQAEYDKNEFETVREKRDKAFILRGIVVSLIYENDKDALCYYLNSLITDKIANSVNRGFHLEYYGDKPYIPKKSLLDFEDDITKGRNTLNTLTLSLDRRMEDNERNNYVALIELMTLCNLIQARVESYAVSKKALLIGDYVEKCLVYLKWASKFSLLNDMPKVKAYFAWIADELKSKDLQMFNRADVYNIYKDTSKVERTGWVVNNVPNPENIVEHMYKCWLIGLLHLPDEYDEPSYNKQEILELLLIHDLGERITGDINRPEKLKDPKRYDEAESKAMHSLMFFGTYPSSPSLDHYLDLWKKWDNRNELNYKIAKDIDDIQTMYQYCEYNLEHKGLFTIDNTVYWLEGRNRLITEIGKQIFNTLVWNNPMFADLIAEYNAHLKK